MSPMMQVAGEDRLISEEGLRASIPFANVHNDRYRKEVAAWTQRAEPKDRERFTRVIADLGALGTKRRPSTEEPQKVQQPQLHASALRRNIEAKLGASALGGWTYVATKAATKKRSPHAHEKPAKAMSEARAPESLSVKEATQASSHSNIPSELRALQLAQLQAMQNRDALQGQPSTEQEHVGNPNAEISLYQASYGLYDVDPELYAIGAEAGRGVPMQQSSGNCDGALSSGLEKGELREKMMKSLYDRYNDDVYPGGHLPADSVKEEAFFAWVLKQGLYYSDLMLDADKEDADVLLLEAPKEKKEEILEAIRQVHAMIVPAQFKSHSQAVHCPMASMEDSRLVQLDKDIRRERDHGKPPYRPTKEELEITKRLVRQSTEDARAVARGYDEEDVPLMQMTRNRALDLCWASRPTTVALSSSAALEADSKTQPLTSAALRQIARLNGQAGPTGGKAHARPSTAPKPMLSQSVNLGQMRGGFRSSVSAASERPGTSQSVTELLFERIRQQGDREKVVYRLPPKKILPNESNVPLTQPGMKITLASTYEEAFATKDKTEKQRLSQHFKAVTMPAGKPNACMPMVRARTAYPVPKRFAERPGWPIGRDQDTIFSASYPEQDKAAFLSHMENTSKSNKLASDARIKGNVPFGSNGSMIAKTSDWESEFKDKYVEMAQFYSEDDPVAQRANLKKIWQGPTCPAGRLTISN